VTEIETNLYLEWRTGHLWKVYETNIIRHIRGAYFFDRQAIMFQK